MEFKLDAVCNEIEVDRKAVTVLLHVYIMYVVVFNYLFKIKFP